MIAKEIKFGKMLEGHWKGRRYPGQYCKSNSRPQRPQYCSGP